MSFTCERSHELSGFNFGSDLNWKTKALKDLLLVAILVSVALGLRALEKNLLNFFFSYFFVCYGVKNMSVNNFDIIVNI